MSKHLTIQVNEPCSESWEQMTPNNQGKHCSSCAKSVVDFTQMTDRELLQWWNTQEKTTNSCGRYREDQLNRNIPLPQIPKFGLLRRIAAVATTLVLASGALISQSQINSEQFLLKGKVFGPDKTEVLIGANVVVYENEIFIAGTSTDFDGNYQLRLDEKRNSKNLRIEISYLGYPSIHEEISFQTPNVDFFLEGSSEIMGDIIVGAIAISKREKKIEQKPTLNGVILERDSKEKLIGANLSIVDKKGMFISGSSSDHKGKFKVDLSKLSDASDYFLEISFIGYETQTFPLANLKINQKQKFQLTKGVNLPEIVVSCNSILNRSSLTMGMISVINTESVKDESKHNATDEKTQIKLDREKDFVCFPNPFSNTTNLKFNWSKSERMFLRLMSMDGRIVFEKRILTVAGENRFQIITEDLGIPGGTYIAHLESIEGVVVSIPLINNQF